MAANTPKTARPAAISNGEDAKLVPTADRPMPIKKTTIIAFLDHLSAMWAASGAQAPKRTNEGKP